MKNRVFCMVCILVYLLTMTGCYDERIESFYQTFADAKKNGAIERGWVPSFLPESAVNIREIHDLDTNQIWIRFEIKNEPDTGFLRKDLKVFLENIKGNLPRDPGVKWWPKLLLNDGYQDRSRYSFYKTSEDGSSFELDRYFAIDNETDYLYCWSNSN